MACGDSITAAFISPPTTPPTFNILADVGSCPGGAFGAAATLSRTKVVINGITYDYPTSGSPHLIIWVGAWHIHVVPVDQIYTVLPACLGLSFLIYPDGVTPYTIACDGTARAYVPPDVTGCAEDVQSANPGACTGCTGTV